VKILQKGFLWGATFLTHTVDTATGVVLDFILLHSNRCDTNKICMVFRFISALLVFAVALQ